jgi:hypothetical protein
MQNLAVGQTTTHLTILRASAGILWYSDISTVRGQHQTWQPLILHIYRALQVTILKEDLLIAIEVLRNSWKQQAITDQSIYRLLTTAYERGQQWDPHD